MAGGGRRATDWYRVAELLLFVPASGLDQLAWQVARVAKGSGL